MASVLLWLLVLLCHVCVSTASCAGDQHLLLGLYGAPSSCVPPDCAAKYNGAKNWFNGRTMLCEPVADCPDEMLPDGRYRVAPTRQCVC